MAKDYEGPRVRNLGTVSALTALDGSKIGSVDDVLTQLIPQLDGDPKTWPDGS